ncbi:MAG: MmgE/PrpD family protein [Desulfobacterales bacterium]|nr:MmgE/PrpD family protein [Desulfobacterales bacterium]
MTKAQELAAYAVNVSYDEIQESVRQQLKIRIIDSLGCAVGALGEELIQRLRGYLKIMGDGSRSQITVLGGGTASPDRAAFFNSALVRYLDFNDSYLARGETCHPSDNLGGVLAAAEYADRSGRDLLAALAVAYQVQCRLSDVAPVRAKGFDHTVQGSYGLAAGISRALGLDEEKTTNAISICGTAFNALRVTRTGALSNWKGLAAPNTAFCCMHGAFLAKQGITGPLEVFEGNKGFMEAIAGPFEIDWAREGFDRISKTILKKYNAEIHSQAAIEGALELKEAHGFTSGEIDRVEIEIFDVAYHIIGGGEEGDKTIVRTKEEADHSLQYMVAVGLIDGRVMPEQYHPDRIVRSDVQDLLGRVIVREEDEYSRRFPEEHACRVSIFLKGGRVLTREKEEYEGFHTNPMRWENVVSKFERLSEACASRPLRKRIVEAVLHIEDLRVREFTRILSEIGGG